MLTSRFRNALVTLAGVGSSGAWRCASGGFEPLAKAQPAAEDALEIGPMLAPRPQLELHLVGGPALELPPIVADGAVDLLDPRGVRAVEGVGDAQQHRQPADDLLLPRLLRRESRKARPPAPAAA